jgi:Tat protein secretion system quality control protein TatD with DNase activity
MEVLVSNYCFPKFWPKREDVSRLHSKIPGLKLSFGIHPKTVQTTRPKFLDEYLEEILKFKNTVAVGECGMWIGLFKHVQGS